MAKEIKVRAWDKQGKFFYPTETMSDLAKLLMVAFATDFIGYVKGLSDDIVFTQYSGGTDDVGKEIYEDDVCNCLIETENFGDLNVKGVMKWWQDELKFSIQFSSEVDFENRKIKSIRVVGNIYENPELISPIQRK